MIIREAIAEDIPQMVAMGVLMHAESPRFSAFEYSHEKCTNLCQHLIDSPDGRLFVAEKDGGLVGMFAGFAFEHFFSPELTVSDVFVYVLPEHRKGRAFFKLLRAFEASVTPAEGTIEVTLGISTEVHTDETAGVYERLGYKKLGYTMRRTLGDV